MEPSTLETDNNMGGIVTLRHMSI